MIAKESVSTQPKNNDTQENIVKPKTVIRKKASELGTPSISQALLGSHNKIDEVEDVVDIKYEKSVVIEDKDFSKEELLEIWPGFVERYKEQSHIYNTLLNKPDLSENCIVVITVENSVQQDKIRFLKPEIIGHLRRTLQNSKIDVEVELVLSTNENRVLTDEQKMKAMIQKNPALILFKNKFNLDFNG